MALDVEEVHSAGERSAHRLRNLLLSLQPVIGSGFRNHIMRAHRPILLHHPSPGKGLPSRNNLTNCIT